MKKIITILTILVASNLSAQIDTYYYNESRVYVKNEEKNNFRAQGASKEMESIMLYCADTKLLVIVMSDLMLSYNVTSVKQGMTSGSRTVTYHLRNPKDNEYVEARRWVDRKELDIIYEDNLYEFK